MSIYESGFDAFDVMLKGLDFDNIAEKALNEAAPILEASMKSAVRAAIMHDGDSELVDSIRKTKAKKAKNNAWIVNVTPKGYSQNKIYYAKNGKGVRTKRKYKVSNALKAIWKEYGIPGRQPAQPFLAKAHNDAQGRVYAKLQEVFNKEADR